MGDSLLSAAPPSVAQLIMLVLLAQADYSHCAVHKSKLLMYWWYCPYWARSWFKLKRTLTWNVWLLKIVWLDTIGHGLIMCAGMGPSDSDGPSHGLTGYYRAWADYVCPSWPWRCCNPSVFFYFFFTQAYSAMQRSILSRASSMNSPC